MHLLKDFYNYVENHGMDRERIYEDQGEGMSLVSFSEQGEENCVYNVALIFYDNDIDVEVYIRKELKKYNEYDLLKQLNELNANYRGITFFIDDKMLTVKSYCMVDGQLECALNELAADMQVARKEFGKLD
ncbi:hypothetical protein I260019D6_24810 [Dorea longicatena]|uniref:hypothetical protein n=1 Tax=Dorea longicatena TaxID=88431 RepID=UPI0036F3E66A